MIKINFTTEKEINEYPDETLFEGFAALIKQMKGAGLKPVKFIGQVSPYLFQLDHGKILDQYGNCFIKKYGDKIWVNSGKWKSMEQLQELPDAVAHPKNPKMQIKTMKIFPSSLGMPKDLDELVTKMTGLSDEFDQVGIQKYLPTNNSIWNGPLSNPQALAYFTGKHHSNYVLYLGSNHFTSDGNLNNATLLQNFTKNEQPKLELVIKTNYGDSYITDKPGPTLMSVSKYIGPLNSVVIETMSNDIKLNVPVGVNLIDLQLMKEILETGIPDDKKKQKYIPKYLI